MFFINKKIINYIKKNVLYIKWFIVVLLLVMREKFLDFKYLVEKLYW